MVCVVDITNYPNLPLPSKTGHYLGLCIAVAGSGHFSVMVAGGMTCVQDMLYNKPL
jgi:hypothetical protein